jgi:hypothetical protein
LTFDNSLEPIRCEAITKKGRQCKKVFVPRHSKAKYCSVHRRQRSVPQLREYNKIKKSNFERLVDGAKIASGTAATVKIVYEVVRFLIAHWSDINRFFHGLDTNSHYQYWHHYSTDCRNALAWHISDAHARDLIVEFQNYFPTLPTDVQRMVFAKFGEQRIKDIYSQG